MKSRRIVIVIEADSDLPISKLREVKVVDLLGLMRQPVRLQVEQIQCNVIRKD